MIKSAQDQVGLNMAMALSSELSEIEGIARSLAEYAAYSPKDPETIKAIIPRMLNSLGRDGMVAGGGLWPEPYWFDPEKERSSFFWGRTESGSFEFFDNYNDPQSKGYHQEEWYVPARYLSGNNLYWSKSYTDPYSLQPMVTCTAPMFKAGRFVGAVTIDLKLDRLSELLDRGSKNLDIYSFVVDRNNKFITFPLPERVKTIRRSVSGEFSDYLYLHEFAKEEPFYSYLNDRLLQKSKEFYTSHVSSSHFYHELVNNIARSSYQVETAEAEIIAANIWKSKTRRTFHPEEIDHFEQSFDPLLGEPVSVVVYSMPGTHWKVVTVFKRSTNLRFADQVSFQLFAFITLAVFLFGLVAFVGLRNVVLNPIKDMTEQVSSAVSRQYESGLRVRYHRSDELGQLAYWFNVRAEQLEKARDDAQIAHQAKSNFLAKMSHELRTPLNSIIGFSRRLKIKLENKLDERSYESIKKIHKNGHQLLDLINDILELSEVESGNNDLALEVYRVNGLLEAVKSQVYGRAEDKGLELEVKYLPGDDFVYCDRQKFTQVLVNLLSNAIKFTFHGGVKLVASKENTDYGLMLKVEVIDSGIGIEEENLSKLFKRFSQIDNRIGGETGTGVGLYLTKRLVELHKGKIEVESKKGVGSTFAVYFPLEHNFRT